MKILLQLTLHIEILYIYPPSSQGHSVQLFYSILRSLHPLTLVGIFLYSTWAQHVGRGLHNLKAAFYLVDRILCFENKC
jgi:hypothetical protein